MKLIISGIPCLLFVVQFALLREMKLCYAFSTSITSNFAVGKIRSINPNNNNMKMYATQTEKETTTKKTPKAKKSNKSTNKKTTKQRNPQKAPPSRKDVTEPLLPLTDLVLGSTIDGYVAAFTSFGIFIKTNYDLKNRGANGYALLHKSQIRDEPVDDLSKLFRIGAQVKGLRVIDINYAKGEVGLSLRSQRAKRINMNEIPVGKDIQGTVSKVVAYGVFVDIGADVNALVHISRISQQKIKNIRQVLNEGDKVDIHILSKDKKNRTMAASMLDKEADEYLDRRMAQMEKMRESVTVESLKSELEYFEDAVRELEGALKNS